MTIAQNSEFEIPLVGEPEEFDPVELFRLAAGRFRYSEEDFACAMGCEVSTLKKWKCGQKVGRANRINAARLKHDWGL